MLQEKALLVRLSISIPGNTRKDPRLTSETIVAHNLGAGSGRWLKQLYPDAAFKPLVTLQGEVRTWHYANTLPWSDEGYRILPTAHHTAYCDAMRSFRSRFDAARDTFVGGLDSWLDWARMAHNGTFDAGCYPKSPEALRSKFGLQLDFSPVPSGTDFRCRVDQNELDAMAAQVNDRVAQATEAARVDLWQRLAEPIRNMVARLSDPEGIFRDSLIGNLQEIVGLVPALNVTGDGALASFAAEVQSTLAGLSPETLRTDSSTRESTAKQAADILSRMEGYFA